MPVVSVITGDIVNSTKLPKAKLKTLIRTMEMAFKNHQCEFFRGDSFQVLIKSPKECLAVLLLARTAVMKLSPDASKPLNDIKASIGIGSVRLPISSLRTASGEAFILSGRAFESMEEGRLLSITCNEKYQVIHAGLKVIAYFTDYLFQRLTVKQAAVVYELLTNRAQTEIAKKLKKSQATVHKHVQAAGWPEIAELLADYKKMTDSIKV